MVEGNPQHLPKDLDGINQLPFLKCSHCESLRHEIAYYTFRREVAYRHELPIIEISFKF